MPAWALEVKWGEALFGRRVGPAGVSGEGSLVLSTPKGRLLRGCDSGKNGCNGVVKVSTEERGN